MKNHKRSNKGITLIALVITIIILLILSTIIIYSGQNVIKSSKFDIFSTELKAMQTNVNELYEKYKSGETVNGLKEEEILTSLGKDIESSSEVSAQAIKVFTEGASGITDKTGYRYFDEQTLKDLKIEGIGQEFFINIEKRSVVSYQGFEYENKTYYTVEQLTNNLYNVEYKENSNKPVFDISYEMIADGKYKITVSNIQHEGYISKWQVRYKLEKENYWNTIDSLSFIVTEEGKYSIYLFNEGIISETQNIVVAREVSTISNYAKKDIFAKDDFGNYLIVPEDFKIRIDDTTNNADTVNEGIVVEDRNGNQFVWVPVGDVKTDSEGTTVNITLGRYDFADGSDSYKDADGNVLAEGTPIPYSGSYTEDTEASHNSSYGNAIAKNITNFVNNSNSNHGYYIGRYEAGVVNGAFDTSEMLNYYTAPNNSWTGYKAEEGKEIELVCKTGQQVWNYVTQNKASELARKMYTGKKYESDLINSYAWDTAILFIQKCGTKANSGTYSWQTRLQSSPAKTGEATDGTNKDEQCNIYDMAGNDDEWTTETCSSSSLPCVRRGGSYSFSSDYTSIRSNSSTTLAYDNGSFRPLLYW